MSGPVLLVSVRDADEVAAAVAGGAAIIDIKDPGRGSLGRPSAENLVPSAAAVPAGLPWTLAAGELQECSGPGDDRFQQLLATLGRPPAAVKFGLSGCSGTDWLTPLRQAAARLPPGTPAVPVAYADARQAAAPPVLQVIDRAARAGLPLVLIDTYDKQASGSLLTLIPPAELNDLISRARAAGLGILLAGRLALNEIPVVAGCQPDAVAVRSAVCRGGRLGRIDRPRVATAVDHCRRVAGVRVPFRLFRQQGVSG